MAEFLVVPIVVFLMLFTIWAISAAKKAKRAAVPISRLAGRSEVWKTQFAALGYQEPRPARMTRKDGH